MSKPHLPSFNHVRRRCDVGGRIPAGAGRLRWSRDGADLERR